MGFLRRTPSHPEPEPQPHGAAPNKPGRSVYEDRGVLTTEGDDEMVWHQVGELDPFTGAWRGRPDWSMGWHPFPGRRP
jgi:hypothetical protein